ncbi:MAG: DUF456 domain-containing protein [Anaerolineae bacterium]|nr:DUF456 domain-containing protein [Anaerolineae bacterium]
MAETALLAVILILMVVVVLASILPVVPGPAAVWALGILYAVLTEFEQVTALPLIVMTVLMILGSTTTWWMQALGMKAQGGSWTAIIGGLIGGLAGTFLIPIPIVGTLIGVVGGTLLFELLRLGDANKAAQSGIIAVKGYLITLLTETGISALIVIVFAAAAVR